MSSSSINNNINNNINEDTIGKNTDGEQFRASESGSLVDIQNNNNNNNINNNNKGNNKGDGGISHNDSCGVSSINAGSSLSRISSKVITFSSSDINNNNNNNNNNMSDTKEMTNINDEAGRRVSSANHSITNNNNNNSITNNNNNSISNHSITSEGTLCGSQHTIEDNNNNDNNNDIYIEVQGISATTVSSDQGHLNLNNNNNNNKQNSTQQCATFLGSSNGSPSLHHQTHDSDNDNSSTTSDVAFNIDNNNNNYNSDGGNSMDKEGHTSAASNVDSSNKTSPTTKVPGYLSWYERNKALLQEKDFTGMTPHEAARMRIKLQAEERKREMGDKALQTLHRTAVAGNRRGNSENINNRQASATWFTVTCVIVAAQMFRDKVSEYRSLDLLRRKLMPLLSLRSRDKRRRVRLAEIREEMSKPSLEVLKTNEILALFPDKQLQQIIDGMELRLYFESDILMYQGTRGYESFIINSGSATINIDKRVIMNPYLPREEGFDPKVPKGPFLMKKNFIIGIPDTVACEPTMATVRAYSELTVWVIKKSLFDKCVEEDTKIRSALSIVPDVRIINVPCDTRMLTHPAGLSRFPIFSVIKREILLLIAQTMEPVTYPTGGVIVNEGSRATSGVYIIQGQVSIRITVPAHTSRDVALYNCVRLCSDIYQTRKLPNLPFYEQVVEQLTDKNCRSGKPFNVIIPVEAQVLLGINNLVFGHQYEYRIVANTTVVAMIIQRNEFINTLLKDSSSFLAVRKEANLTSTHHLAFWYLNQCNTQQFPRSETFKLYNRNCSGMMLEARRNSTRCNELNRRSSNLNANCGLPNVSNFSSTKGDFNVNGSERLQITAQSNPDDCFIILNGRMQNDKSFEEDQEPHQYMHPFFWPSLHELYFGGFEGSAMIATQCVKCVKITRKDLHSALLYLSNLEPFVTSKHHYEEGGSKYTTHKTTPLYSLRHNRGGVRAPRVGSSTSSTGKGVNKGAGNEIKNQSLTSLEGTLTHRSPSRADKEHGPTSAFFFNEMISLIEFNFITANNITVVPNIVPLHVVHKNPATVVKKEKGKAVSSPLSKSTSSFLNDTTSSLLSLSKSINKGLDYSVSITKISSSVVSSTQQEPFSTSTKLLLNPNGKKSVLETPLQSMSTLSEESGSNEGGSRKGSATCIVVNNPSCMVVPPSQMENVEVNNNNNNNYNNSNIDQGASEGLLGRGRVSFNHGNNRRGSQSSTPPEADDGVQSPVNKSGTQIVSILDIAPNSVPLATKEGKAVTSRTSYNNSVTTISAQKQITSVESKESVTEQKDQKEITEISLISFRPKKLSMPKEEPMDPALILSLEKAQSKINTLTKTTPTSPKKVVSILPYSCEQTPNIPKHGVSTNDVTPKWTPRRTGFAGQKSTEVSSGNPVITYSDLLEIMKDHMSPSSPYSMENMAKAQTAAAAIGGRPVYDTSSGRRLEAINRQLKRLRPKGGPERLAGTHSSLQDRNTHVMVRRRPRSNPVENTFPCSNNRRLIMLPRDIIAYNGRVEPSQPLCPVLPPSLPVTHRYVPMSTTDAMKMLHSTQNNDLDKSSLPKSDMDSFENSKNTEQEGGEKNDTTEEIIKAKEKINPKSRSPKRTEGDRAPSTASTKEDGAPLVDSVLFKPFPVCANSKIRSISDRKPREVTFYSENTNKARDHYRLPDGESADHQNINVFEKGDIIKGVERKESGMRGKCEIQVICQKVIKEKDNDSLLLNGIEKVKNQQPPPSGRECLTNDKQALYTPRCPSNLSSSKIPSIYTPRVESCSPGQSSSVDNNNNNDNYDQATFPHDSNENTRLSPNQCKNTNTSDLTNNNNNNLSIVRCKDVLNLVELPAFRDALEKLELQSIDMINMNNSKKRTYFQEPMPSIFSISNSSTPRPISSQTAVHHPSLIGSGRLPHTTNHHISPSRGRCTKIPKSVASSNQTQRTLSIGNGHHLRQHDHGHHGSSKNYRPSLKLNGDKSQICISPNVKTRHISTVM